MSALELDLTGPRTRTGDPFAYPESEEQWRDWYLYRHDAYTGANYDTATIRTLQLFRALDDNGDLIAQTRRLGRDVQYVVEVAVAALAGGPLALQALEVEGEAAGGQAARLAAAQAVWRRSRMGREQGRYARILASMGDLYVEANRDRKTGKTRLVWYEPHNVHPVYDDAGLELEKAVITHYFAAPAKVDLYGQITEVGPADVTQRTLTRTDVTVTLNGKVLEGVGGPHGLGVVPLVHIPCVPYCEPEHSLWVGHAMDRPRAEVDSLLSQISAIGNRFANPKLVIQGAQVAADSKISLWGRVINIFGQNSDKAEVKYLEINGSGLKALLDAAFQQLDDVRQTLPEYLFAAAGANASGDALRLRAAQFEAKYLQIRGNFYEGLARATAFAVAMDAGQPFDPDAPGLVVTGPPILPANVKAELEGLEIADRIGAVNAVDKVRHSQRLGIASSDQSAEDYAAELEDRAAERASTFFGEPGKKAPEGEEEVEDDENTEEEAP